jgi:flagella basal body P-ring formation protein FlgA
MRRVAAVVLAWAVALPTALFGEPSIEPRVEAAIMAAVRDRMGPEATVGVGLADLSVPADVTGELAVVPAPDARIGGLVDFTVIGTGGDGRARQIGRARAMVWVVVPHARATRLLSRGTVLAEGDVTAVTAEPGRVPLKRLPRAEAFIGSTARRDLAAGEVLTSQSAPPAPDVRAGDQVQALLSVGAVVVTANLTAVDSGTTGAMVRVVNRDSRRELRARVLGPGMVEVLHGDR